MNLRFPGSKVKKKAVQMEETATAKAQRDSDTYTVYNFTYQKLRLVKECGHKVGKVSATGSIGQRNSSI